MAMAMALGLPLGLPLLLGLLGLSLLLPLGLLGLAQGRDAWDATPRLRAGLSGAPQSGEALLGARSKHGA